MALLEVNQAAIARGGKTIVSELSFAVDHGQVVGLIGPNGAGKSTTLGGILGLYPLESGQIELSGTEVTKSNPLPAEVKSQIAYIPEQPLYYPDLTLMEHFQWKERLWRTYRKTPMTNDMDLLIEEFELGPHLNKFPDQCSKGTLQKLMIVSALMFPFQLLVIDEPFIGLDILAIRQLKRRIEFARREGAGVLISTHVLDAAEKMCSEFVLMSTGRVFASGTVDALMQQANQSSASLEELFVDIVLAERRNQKEPL